MMGQAKWLPNFASEIDATCECLNEAKCNGRSVKLMETEGAAHLYTKTVEEMAEDRVAATANANVSDKENMMAEE